MWKKIKLSKNILPSKLIYSYEKKIKEQADVVWLIKLQRVY